MERQQWSQCGNNQVEEARVAWVSRSKAEDIEPGSHVRVTFIERILFRTTSGLPNHYAEALVKDRDEVALHACCTFHAALYATL